MTKDDLRRGTKRRCPHCGILIASNERLCPECGRRLYPPVHPITADSVDTLFAQTDKQHLTLLPEFYYSNAQAYAYNWQIREASLELAKVLLVAPPNSDIHKKARQLLQRLGFKFPAKDFLDLARQGENAWWRYLASVFVVIVGWVALTFVISFLLGVSLEVISSLGGSGGAIDEPLQDVSELDPAIILAAGLLSFVALIAALFVAVRFVHQRPFMSLITRLPRFNWRRAATGFAVFFFLAAVVSVIEALIYPGSYQLTWKAAEFMKILPIVLILVPIQSAAEEFLCRGYIMQGLGLISRRFLFPAIGSSLIFMALHFANPEVDAFPMVAFSFYFCAGLLFALVALKDQRLELAIGAHAGNNVFGFLLVSGADSAIATPTIFTVSGSSAAYTLGSFIVAAIIYYMVFFGRRRASSTKTSEPAVEQPNG